MEVLHSFNSTQLCGPQEIMLWFPSLKPLLETINLVNLTLEKAPATKQYDYLLKSYRSRVHNLFGVTDRITSNQF